MSKTISEIYTEYKIMPNLQLHMLRVAAVAHLICENFDGSLQKEEIITTCLLHDMGNIIKSKFEYFPEFIEPEGLEYWQNVKNEYIRKYGNNEEKANIQIIEELKVGTKIISLAKQNNFFLTCKNRESDMAVKIVNYADWRVSPYGIVSYEERMQEGKKRYKLNSQAEDNEREKLIVCGQEIEQQIFAKCKIKPKDINNETAAPVISKLRDFVIK